MRIQHNIMAMNAYRNYSNNTSALSKNLEKLSSGYKINRAGDDAAGLAISEKMRAQITGLKTAQKNAKDGISLIQTAEGALTEVHDMLNRMVELADQSANGTYDDNVDRANLQKEFDALRSEIDRISKATNFNGIDLLNGKQENGRDLTELSGIDGLPDVGTILGTDTVLHAGGATAAKTSFNVELHNSSYMAAASDEISITIGEGTGATTLTVKATSAGKMSASAIQAAFVKKYGASGTATATINGQAFEVTGSGSRLTFTQKNLPTTASQVVSANQKVKISAVAATANATVGGSLASTAISLTETYTNGTVGSAFSSTAIKALTNIKTVTNGTAGGGTMTATKVAAAINGLKLTGITATATITMRKVGGSGTDKDNLGIYVGDTMIAKSTIGFTGIASNATATFTFKALASGNATVGVIKIAATAGQGSVPSGVLDNAVKIGFTHKTNAANKSITMTSASEAKLAALARSMGAKSGDIKVGMGTDGKYQLLAGSTVIATAAAVGGTITFQDAAGSTVLVAKAYGAITADDLSGPKAVSTGLTFTGDVGKSTLWGAATSNPVQVGAYATGAMTSDAFALTLTHATSVTSTLNASAIASIINALGSKVVGSAAELGLKRFTSGSKTGHIGLYVGGQLIGISKAAAAAVTDTAPKKLEFVSAANSSVALGDITITAKSGSTVNATAISASATVGIGLSFKSPTKYIDNVNVASSAALQALADKKGAKSGEFTIGMGSNGKYQLKVGDTVLATAAATTGGTVTFKDGSTTVMSVKAHGAITATDMTKTNGVKTGVKFTAAADNPNRGDWNVSTTDNVTGAAESDMRLASTKFTLDKSKIVDGGSIRIGDKTYTFAVGSDSKVAASASNVVDLRHMSALASDATASQVDAFLHEAGMKLTQAAEGNKVFTVGHQGNGVITVTETVSNSNASDGVKLDTKDKIAAQLGYGGVSKTSKGLTLQIGDTSDDYNQLTVSIKNMNCESLGIDASQISIADQTSAQAAVSVLKNAINSVSSTRGDLGAMQNRLEHTINNLSVMQENIQDAESTIRDVDVAEEMMAYTKNNILVQSAQAMLAQANQVPQGVLQLLQ